MKQISVILIGAGGRGQVYTNVMAELPEKYKVVAVAEPIADRRNYIREKFNVTVLNFAYNTMEMDYLIRQGHNLQELQIA